MTRRKGLQSGTHPPGADEDSCSGSARAPVEGTLPSTGESVPSRNRSRSRSLRILGAGLFGGGFLFVVGVLVLLAPWPESLARAIVPAHIGDTPIDNRLLARDGSLLRHPPDVDGIRKLHLPLTAYPNVLRNAVLAAEDSRFYQHPGIDPVSILRAFWDNLTYGRVVSGASTISQQVIRIMQPRPRTLGTKIVETIQAIALEKIWSKDRILEAYLNRVPMPGPFQGMSMGALTLFDRPVGELTIAEMCVLAGIPQSPSRFDPRKGSRAQERILDRCRWILQRMSDLGFLSSGEVDVAAREPIAYSSRTLPFVAPHLCDHILDEREGPGPHRTTLDRRFQIRAEGIVQSHKSRLLKRGCRQAACLVVDNESGEVRAWVGSTDWAETHQGFNDGVRARRSAGSTLKPFAYALGLERGLNLATRLVDLDRTYTTPNGDYRPENFDEVEYGPVAMRPALAGSLNASAVDLARRVGASPIADLLEDLGLIAHGSGKDLGIGIVIGNAEITLEGLVSAYRTLSRGGRVEPLRYRQMRAGNPPARSPIAAEDPGIVDVASPRHVIREDVAYLIRDVLADPTARFMNFGHPLALDYPFPVALKTGTSTEYRDCWAVGTTGDITVGVWTGNFNGSSTGGLAGSSAAAPILKDLILAWYGSSRPSPWSRPAGIEERVVCADSGGLLIEACPHSTRELFLTRKPMPEPCAVHGVTGESNPGSHGNRFSAAFARWSMDREARGVLSRHSVAAITQGPGGSGLEITYPQPGDRFVTQPGSDDWIVVKASPQRSVPYLRWFLDSIEVAQTQAPYRWRWPLTRGQHRIVATTPDLSEAAAVRVNVD